jgi:ribosomal protein S14
MLSWMFTDLEWVRNICEGIRDDRSATGRQKSCTNIRKIGECHIPSFGEGIYRSKNYSRICLREHLNVWSIYRELVMVLG